MRERKGTMPRPRACVPALGLVLFTASCAIPHWPVEGPMTSAYGVRMDGWLPEVHRGVDVAVPLGTPVRAMASGRVEMAGTRGAYGTLVILRHNNNLSSLYAHLSELRVRTGAEVRRGDVIGLSGASGNASGPHLHFEIIRWQRAEDPVLLLGRPPRSTR